VNEYLGAGDNAAAIPLLERMRELRPGELLPLEYLGILYLNLPGEKPECANALPWLLEAERRYI
jgi:hypothetical protein